MRDFRAVLCDSGNDFKDISKRGKRALLEQLDVSFNTLNEIVKRWFFVAGFVFAGCLGHDVSSFTFSRF